jgi:hypothetical protein
VGVGAGLADVGDEGTIVPAPMDDPAAGSSGVAGGGSVGSSVPGSVSGASAVPVGVAVGGSPVRGGADALVPAFGGAVICGFNCASVSVSVNVTASPGPGRVSFGSFSSGGASSSVGGGFTGMRPMTRVDVSNSRFPGGAAPAAAVTD